MVGTTPPRRTGHPYHMHDAIYAQPGALRLVARGQDDALAAAAGRLRAAERVLLAGVGTSWHAALAGELFLAHAGRLGHRVRAVHSFELVHYWPAPDDRMALVVLSHRGTTRSSRDALARATAGGGGGIAVTGKGADGLAAADCVLRTVEQEASECHTVSYTCALWLLASLAASVGGDDELAHAREELPDLLAMLLGQEACEELAARLAGRRRYYFVGAGPNTATAYEAALKTCEAADATALGVECEEFLHGPWAALGPEDAVFLIAPPGPSRPRALDVARAVQVIGAPLVALAAEDDRELAAVATQTIALPSVPELLSPILAVVPLQLFAYYLAVHLGVDPDVLRADDPVRARARDAFAR